MEKRIRAWAWNNADVIVGLAIGTWILLMFGFVAFVVSSSSF